MPPAERPGGEAGAGPAAAEGRGGEKGRAGAGQGRAERSGAKRGGRRGAERRGSGEGGPARGRVRGARSGGGEPGSGPGVPLPLPLLLRLCVGRAGARCSPRFVVEFFSPANSYKLLSNANSVCVCVDLSVTSTVSCLYKATTSLVVALLFVTCSCSGY